MRSLAVFGILVVLAAFVPAAPAAAADADIRINEVQSDDPGGGEDWFELTNVGTESVDVSNWLVKDSDDSRTLRLPEGTQIAPGTFYSMEPDAGEDGFGLGSEDQLRIYAADGTTLIDQAAWTAHASTEGRLPDGTGEWSDLEPSRDAPNTPRGSDVVLNEVESNGDSRGDWIELANSNTEQTADVSGWTITDSGADNAPLTLPEGTEIESGGYLGILTNADGGFGLGNPDSVTIRDASGAVVDSYQWDDHARTTYGRCPDLTGDFGETSGGSFELPNACGEEEEPDVDAGPWPFNDTVRDAVAPDTWGEDMSGLDFSSEGTLFAVNNDNAEIFRLAEEAGMFSIAQSWVPRYPDGSGQPDAEGLTVAADGSIFLASERDNAADDVSRPSVLKVVTDGDEAATTQEWNLAEQLGELGANAGLEGIEWIADADATRLGVTDNGAPYSPDDYGPHGGGIFAISVEQTGAVILAVLEDGGEVSVLQSATLGPDVSVAMSLDWRAGGNELWAQCDEACDNRASRLTFESGDLTWDRDVRAPAGMPVQYTNEGLAMRWCSSDPQADPTVAWISDTAHEGVSLRVADGGECSAAPAPEPTDPDPTASQEPRPTDPQDPRPDPPGEGPEDGSAGGNLPRTGVSNAVGALLAGVALIVAGGAFIALGRRRSS